MSVPPPSSGIDAAYENAGKKLEQQLASIDALDTKAAAMIGILGVIVGGFIVGAKTDPERWIGGISLALATVCLLYRFGIRGYANAPDPNVFASYAGHNSDQMQALFLKSILDAIEWNERRRTWKVRALNAAFTLIALFGLVVLVIVAMKFDPRV